MAPPLILLVEDNESDVELTRQAFDRQPAPYTLVVAEDGQEALDYLFASGAHAGPATALPAVVLLDLKMPRVDGLTVLARMRAMERTRCVPVVVFSTSADERDVRRSYELGANSYLRKPVDFPEFADALARVAHYWLALNRTPAAS